jgi:5-hmdU DNA kinase, helical domain
MSGSIPKLATTQQRKPSDGATALFDFAVERYLIYKKRNAGLPKPWTTDPILLEWRFCNVYRECDTVTRWIAENWRDRHHDDPHLWFAICVARFVNWPDTLAELGYPVPWKASKFLKVMERRRKAGEKVYSGAYMIRSDKEFTGIPKAQYQAEQFFNPLWRDRSKLRPMPGDTCGSYHVLLSKYYGFGSFMAAQIVADMKYAPPLCYAFDWATFAASGPGSKRGLNRVLDRPPKEAWGEYEWRAELINLRARLLPWFSDVGMPEPHAQDVQNILCEWDKFQRIKLGEGRPRARYDGYGDGRIKAT